jgi:glycosylphosphatidylinositol transamidase
VIATALRALRRDRNRLLSIATPVSLLCMLAGLTILLTLPLDKYSRRTYISENALLPGQVHTYFDGSEHNVFRAYRHEVNALMDKSREERVQRFGEIFESFGLRSATQQYRHGETAGNATGENVYALLRGPRADATEAICLIAAWKNMNGEENQSGVALLLTLARYFKRWSLWSKDIIFIIPEDSIAGPQAWVDAYHDAHDPRVVEGLTIKSGALQGAVAVDYPAGPWGHRFDKLHVVYDGINGQLPNLDLINTAISIAQGQMGMGIALQRMWDHSDSGYKDRLTTLARGMLNQALGHGTGPHSGFMRYHVDAITLQTVGDGWHDEMSLGRTIEGLFRSLNNLLEHLHQSFFFYLLMHSSRFVSIGTYLPSAMAIAASFTVMSIALWFRTGIHDEALTKPEETKSESKKDDKKAGDESDTRQQPPAERYMFLPLLTLTTTHFLGLIPLWLFNNTAPSNLVPTFYVFSALTVPLLPVVLALVVVPAVVGRRPTAQELTLQHCFTLLLLGMCFAALATVNFSLACVVGGLCCPLAFVRVPAALPSKPTEVADNKGAKASSKTEKSQDPKKTVLAHIRNALLAFVLLFTSPPAVIYAASTFAPGGLEEVLKTAAFGWWVCGLWTQVVVWLVWWPAWVAGGMVLVNQILF